MKLIGRLQIDNGVRVLINSDLVRYYRYFVDIAHYRTIRWETPKHGAHVSVYLPNIHGEYPKRNLYKLVQGAKIEMEYNPEDLRSGGRGFTNWWFPIKSPRIEEIKKLLEVRDNARYLGLHLVVCNSKNDDDYIPTHKK